MPFGEASSYQTKSGYPDIGLPQTIPARYAMSFAHLPPELEYSIFLIAYENDSKDAKNLTLVAKRVFEWLIPHIFNVVKICQYGASPIQFNKSTYQKYGRHVRHLLIDHNDLREHLPLFPNVINIAFWIPYDPISLEYLLQLPLERISVGSDASSPAIFQLLQNVTHLDYIPDFRPTDQEITSVLYLPNLTHLCVTSLLTKESFRLFLDKERCPKLRVVAIWFYGYKEVELETGLDEVPDEVKDERIVRIKCNAPMDWEIGARGGMDTWMFAEMVVASRACTRRT